MCCTIGPSTCSRGSVTLRCRPSARIGKRSPTSAATSFAQAPAALTMPMRADPPAGVVDGEAVRAGVRLDLDAGHLGVRADRPRRARPRAARRAARRAAGWRGPPRDSTRHRRGRRRGTERTRAAPRPVRTCVSRPASCSISCLSRSNCSSSGVSATIRPPVVWMSSGPSSSASSAARSRPPRRGAAPRSAAGRARCPSPTRSAGAGRSGNGSCRRSCRMPRG